MIHKKIKFKGETYWYHDENKGHILISPLDHYDDDGDLVVSPFTAISFAVVEGNNIMQWGEPIGTIDDLEDEE